MESQVQRRTYKELPKLQSVWFAFKLPQKEIQMSDVWNRKICIIEELIGT